MFYTPVWQGCILDLGISVALCWVGPQGWNLVRMSRVSGATVMLGCASVCMFVCLWDMYEWREDISVFTFLYFTSCLAHFMGITCLRKAAQRWKTPTFLNYFQLTDVHTKGCRPRLLSCWYFISELPVPAWKYNKDNINFNTAKKKTDQSLLNFKTGIGVGAYATLDIEHLIFHTRTAVVGTVVTLWGSDGEVILVSEVHELCTKCHDILDNALCKWIFI